MTRILTREEVESVGRVEMDWRDVPAVIIRYENLVQQLVCTAEDLYKRMDEMVSIAEKMRLLSSEQVTTKPLFEVEEQKQQGDQEG